MPLGQCPRCDETHHMRIPKMTTAEKLQAKINKEMQFITSGIQKVPQMDGGEMTKNIHIANLLAPLLLEMVDVLEKYRNVAGYDQRHSVTQFSEADVMLRKFEEFLK